MSGRAAPYHKAHDLEMQPNITRLHRYGGCSYPCICMRQSPSAALTAVFNDVTACYIRDLFTNLVPGHCLAYTSLPP